MKKIAIALVIVACLLTGALLPALAETDLSRPAAAEEPRMEEKTPGETELPAREETPKATDGREDRAASEAEPVAPKATRAPKATDEREDPAASEAEPAAPKATRAPKATDGREDPAASEAEPAAPKATRAPKATDGRKDRATPEEKPDAFEAPEPSQRHGHHGAAHPHGKRHHGGEGLRPGPGADMPRRPGAGERPRQAAPHCRRWCGPERSRPHCAGCPFGRECPGWENDQPAETLPAPLPEQESRQAEEPAKKTTLRLGPGMAV